MHVVWFKKDLRLFDHQPLARAASEGPVLLLYIIEPSLWAQPDQSSRHYQHMLQCLADLQKQLSLYQAQLVIKVSEVVPLLEKIHKKNPITTLYSHQETGNLWSSLRDKKVRSWAKCHGVKWEEFRQNGVIRGLADRASWQQHWYAWARSPLIPEPKSIQAMVLPSDRIPTTGDLGLAHDGIGQAIIGGRSEALARLQSFLQGRGKHYTKAMSSPITAFEACSRLSADFAFGSLSLKEVFQHAESALKNLNSYPMTDQLLWRSALQSLMRRLRWHCHFIQKLEDEPSIEYQALHPAFRSLWLPQDENAAYRTAWEQGQTGFPYIDACMRCLKQTGWINFRARAMLISFASHHLWLPWQKSAQYLAQLFVDYEPGIHYPQIQMQAGCTGMNTIRIYNPIKQGLDHDPEALFIKKWVPELASLSCELAHQPWLACQHISDYPLPIVREKDARTQAAARLYGVSKTPQETLALIRKHARGRSYGEENNH